jgi:hypothetical protein
MYRPSAPRQKQKVRTPTTSVSNKPHKLETLMTTTKFSLGQIVATPGALEVFEKTGQSPTEFLSIHNTGNWGDLCDEDKQTNEQSLVDGGRIFSAYHLNDGTKIWIITEADRSSTCVLLPSEY